MESLATYFSALGPVWQTALTDATIALDPKADDLNLAKTVSKDDCFIVFSSLVKCMCDHIWVINERGILLVAVTVTV